MSTEQGLVSGRPGGCAGGTGETGTGGRFSDCPEIGDVGCAGSARELAGLLTAIAGGDRSAFREFYRLTSPRVYGLATRMLRGHRAAEQVTQEVYLRVWSTAHRYDPAAADPIGWLMTIAHRRIVVLLRAELAVGREFACGRAYPDIEVAPSRNAAQRAARHDERWCREVARERVLGALDMLSAPQRHALALAYYGGRTYREIAELLSVPLPVLKTRLRDGLTRLGQGMTGERTDE